MGINTSTHSIRKEIRMFVRISPVSKFIKYVKDQLKPRETLRHIPVVVIEDKIEVEEKEESLVDVIDHVCHSLNESVWVYSCYPDIVSYSSELTSLYNRLQKLEKIPLLSIVPNNVQASEWFIAEGVQKLPSALLVIFMNRIDLLENLIKVKKEELTITPNFTHSRSIAACEFTLSNAKNILKELQSVRRPV